MDSDRMSDFRERGSIFKQMAEMKKKIQLVNNLMTSQKCFYGVGVESFDGEGQTTKFHMRILSPTDLYLFSVPH